MVEGEHGVLHIKPPKSHNSNRTLALAPSTVALLREHPRREQWLGAFILAAGLVFVAIAQLGTPRDRWWRHSDSPGDG